jgi:hypothetical protein
LELGVVVVILCTIVEQLEWLGGCKNKTAKQENINIMANIWRKAGTSDLGLKVTWLIGNPNNTRIAKLNNKIENSKES